MSDLISRSELYDELGNKLTWLMAYGDDVYLDVGSDIKDVIDNQPTAYEIDKVVEELKTDSSVKLYGSENSDNYLIPVKRAIEIFKQGGVDDDVCEVELLRGYKFLHETSCGNTFDMGYGFKYCPYCGKKIKAVKNNDKSI